MASVTCLGAPVMRLSGSETSPATARSCAHHDQNPGKFSGEIRVEQQIRSLTKASLPTFFMAAQISAVPDYRIVDRLAYIAIPSTR